TYRIEQGADGALRRFEYEIDADRFLRITRPAESAAGEDRRMPAPRVRDFVAELVPIEKTRTIQVVRGTIDRRAPSLFAAMEAAGEAVDLSVSLAEIFAGEIDFHVDVR